MTTPSRQPSSRALLTLCAALTLLSACGATTSEPVAARPAQPPASATDAPPAEHNVFSADWARYRQAHPVGSGLEHASLRDPELPTEAAAAALAEDVKAMIDAANTDWYSADDKAIAYGCDRLVEIEPVAATFYACGRFLMRAHRLDEALDAYETARALGYPDAGMLHARLAAVYSAYEDAPRAHAHIERAVDAGFNAFTWINTSYELGYLHEQPDWPARYAELVPVNVALDQPNISGRIHIDAGREGETYTLCANGRYRYESYREGFWSIEDGALVLTPARACEGDWDDASGVYHVTCRPFTEEEREDGYQTTPETLLAAEALGDMRQRAVDPSASDPNDWYAFSLMAHADIEEPAFCSAPWPDAPPPPDADADAPSPPAAALY